MHEYAIDWPYIADKALSALGPSLVLLILAIVGWVKAKTQIIEKLNKVGDDAQSAKSHGEDNSQKLAAVTREVKAVKEAATTAVEVAQTTKEETANKLEENTAITKDVNSKLDAIIKARSGGM